MPSELIFRSQLNELIRTLSESDLDLASFEFDRDLSKTDLKIRLPLKIVHRSSGFYFEISYRPAGTYNQNAFRVLLLPGSEPREELHHCEEWKLVIPWLTFWLETVQGELSQPDPWLLLNQGTILTDNIPTAGQTVEMFTEREFALINNHLKDVKDFLVAETNPTAEQLRLIDEKISYLKESARRQAKQDWAHTALGVTFSLAIGLSLAPEQANRLLQLTAQVLQTIFMKLLV